MVSDHHTNMTTTLVVYILPGWPCIRKEKLNNESNVSNEEMKESTVVHHNGELNNEVNNTSANSLATSL